jgi:hypothetical protein
MKHLGFCLAFLLVSPAISQGETTEPETSAQAQPSQDAGTPGFAPLPGMPEGWSALPRGRPFPVLPSDPRDLHLGLRRNSKAELEADVAGYRSLAGWRGEVAGEDTAFHAGIEGAGFFQMRQEGSKFPLASSDGLVGVYGEAARGGAAYQLRYTHISAHLSDGLFGARAPILYTREFLVLRVARQRGFFRPYLGYQFLTHTAPALPRHSFQLGAYAIFPAHWGLAHPYAGADLRLRNAREGTTTQLSAGVAFVSANGMPPVRLAASYLKGHDLRGQFFDEPTEKWIFGLDLDL